MPSSIHNAHPKQPFPAKEYGMEQGSPQLVDSASEELDAIYRNRLRILTRVALACIVPYSCVSLLGGLYGRVGTDIISALMLLASGVFRKRPSGLNLARILFVSGAGFSLFGTTILSGNFESEIPWLFGLIPLGVAHTCGPKYVPHSLTLSALALLFVYFVAPHLPIQQEFFPNAITQFFLVLSSLACFCAIAISSAWTVDCQVEQIRAASIEIMRQRTEVDAATHSKAAFLANMSHEIRTPMNGILGMLEELKRQEGEQAVRELIQTAWLSGSRLLESLNNILDFSKIEAGKLSLVEVEFNPQTLFQRLEKAFEANAQSRQLDFEMSFSSLCPALCGDPLRVEQLLSAIVDNAIRYSRQGEVRVEIESELDSSNSRCRLRFRVSDQGDGISPEAQSRLFSEFEALDEGCDERSGVGLGLVLSRHLCEHMGGTLQLSSQVGHGSVVEFDISLALAQQEGLAPSPAILRSGNYGLRVLVVDDQAINRRVASGHLESLGCHVHLAEDGFSAIEQIGRVTFDLVLMDLHMPGQNGVETARKIRTMSGQGSQVPIAALSGDRDPATVEAAAEAGMRDFLLKPLRREQLVALLDRQQVALVRVA